MHIMGLAREWRTSSPLMFRCGSCTTLSLRQPVLPDQMIQEYAQSGIERHLGMQRAQGVQGGSIQRTQPGERADSSICCDQQRLHRLIFSALWAVRASGSVLVSCLHAACQQQSSESHAAVLSMSSSHAGSDNASTAAHCLSRRCIASQELQAQCLPSLAGQYCTK